MGCVDIITDLDEFLTSDTTEEEILNFVKEICHALGSLIPGFKATCNFLIESQLPAIIDGLVADNLDPTEVCTNVMGACPLRTDSCNGLQILLNNNSFFR